MSTSVYHWPIKISPLCIYRPIHFFLETVVGRLRGIVVENGVKNAHMHHNLKSGVRLTTQQSANIRFAARFGVGVLQKVPEGVGVGSKLGEGRDLFLNGG